MTCLYIDRKGVTLKIANKSLVLYDATGKITSVPLGLLQRLCIKGDLTLSASVLGSLGENDISVLVLRGLQHKPTMLLPSIRQDAKRRLIQMTLANHQIFCLQFAQLLVQKKLEAQYHLILNHSPELCLLDNQKTQMTHHYQMKFQQVAQASNQAFLLGIEGAAANQYFQIISQILPDSLRFTGRNRRPPKDPFNVVLSLGYTLLHYEWVRHIYLMGLDPFIGFYHTIHFGRESLASDLLEPMRPVYDEWAIELFKLGTLRPEDFTMEDGACYMGKAGRLRFYEAYEIWLQNHQRDFHQIKQSLFSAINGKTEVWMPLVNSDELFAEHSLDITMV